MKDTLHFSRRDFLKLAGLTTLAACSGPRNTSETAVPTALPSKTPPPTITAAPTETQAPTTTPTEVPPTATPEAAALRAQARQKLIDEYGAATKALPLEFHGDHYWFYDGAYSMAPDGFVEIMTWFQDNDVWAVNGEELLGFLDGTMQLPARSVILTTDSGAASLESLDRMIPVLQDTGMHFISLIWTMQMLESETAGCPDDACWEMFRKGRDSGVYTFGTHSEYHLPLANYDQTFGFKDLSQSVQEIQDNLGISSEILSWPNESCPVWMDSLEQIGIKAAFGGRSRGLDKCVVYPNDPLRYCLPRLFPPNTHNGLSGRPDGMTLEEMARTYMDWED